ncbi:Y-family DNA polymerase [Albibacterium indicum]|uniref:Y-family DNA polymerase n=1 Tax=Albibacterium indicum TaxID=2292082 RepID=UPI000E47D97F|nr:DNA polymerase Y family protein [Pedobacter indicus]
MQKRYAYIWFQFLLSDWLVIRRPEFKDIPFVFTVSDHGRMVITVTNYLAQQHGIKVGMRLADAKAICPQLEMIDGEADRPLKLLTGLGRWCIRYSPIIMLDNFSVEGVFLDISGCTHLWGGEANFSKEVVSRLKSNGYEVRVAIADTPGAAWAISRFGSKDLVIPVGEHIEALLPLPPEALRLSETIVSKLKKLGFYQIKNLVNMPRSVLRRRFGEEFLSRLGQALGTCPETFKLIDEPSLFQERLSCLEPIKTRHGIEIALEKLLVKLCMNLQKEGKGLRTGLLTCHRVDSKLVKIKIGTNVASNDPNHLFKLFELKIEQIRPGLGIELFVLDAVKVNSVIPEQEALWKGNNGLKDQNVIRLLDRIAGKVGARTIQRYLPAEHFWPERSYKNSMTIYEKPSSEWRTDQPRPTELLKKPEPVEVMSIIPDAPPKFFIYRDFRHTIVKADGPERIEQEWWLENGQHRDYYRVEDEAGQRYWLFRSGHYESEEGIKWFLHGFFA